MTWLQQIGAAVLLVVLTLCLQCAGVAALISWLRTVASDDIQKLRMSYSAALVMRATIAIIILRELSFCFGRAAIAGFVFGLGILPFTSRQPVIRPWDKAMLSSR